MFRYYHSSAICYVYLDIDIDDDEQSFSEAELWNCRWVTRGWTLQELVAPNRVDFYTKSWRFCGTRQSLAPTLSKATRIDIKLLERGPGEPLELSRFSVAQRMSWAADRQTKRPEDVAYCLLGLFNVHIPLLYGEGREKAFYRLQEEIMKEHMDHSILAWGIKHDSALWDQESAVKSGILARAPADFRSCAEIVSFWADGEPFEMTNKGLRITLPIIDDAPRGHIAVLNCRLKNNLNGPLGLRLRSAASDEFSWDEFLSHEFLSDEFLLHRRTGALFYRFRNGLTVVQDKETRKALPRTIYLARNIEQRTVESSESFCFLFKFVCSNNTPDDLRHCDFEKPSIGTWDPVTHVLRVTRNDLIESPEISAWIYDPTSPRGHTIRGAKLFIIRSSALYCSLSNVFHSYQCCILSSTASWDGNTRFKARFERTVQFTRTDYDLVLTVGMAGPPKIILGELVYEVLLEMEYVSKEKIPDTTDKEYSQMENGSETEGFSQTEESS